MRFLHTSDWHLGRTLHGLDLHSAQAAFVDQICEIARTSRVDATVIAGDVFDRAVPPVESVDLFASALHRLSEAGAVIVVGGNHDSPPRLGYGSSLFRDGVHVLTRPDQVGKCIRVQTAKGDLRFWPIPYLDPDHARVVLAGENAPIDRSHEAVMTAALARIETGATPGFDVAIAHAFVVGGQATESERDIRVGGVDSIPAGLFADFGYVALGHLHGPQQITYGTAGAHVRYSGSPLRYSFSEAQQTKSVTLVDADQSGVGIELIAIDQPRGMAVLTGSFDEITSPTNRAAHETSWVKAVLTDAARPANLHERLRDCYPHVLCVAHQPSAPANAIGPDHASLSASDPFEISLRFIEDVTSAPATDAEEIVLRNAYEAALRQVNA